MMRIVLAAVDRGRGGPVQGAVSEYEERLRHYFRYEAFEVPPAGLPDERAAEARHREGEALGRRLPPDLTLVALTRTGRQWSSMDLARRLGECRTYGQPGFAFVIGGAHGLDPDLLKAAGERLALSRMTLPHELARLVLVEQLYRAGTILRGEPYHKGS